MNKNITISVWHVIIVAVALFLGYLWGRSSVEIPEPKVKEVIKWEKEPYPVYDTIKVPEPYRVEVPVDRPVPVPIATDTAALFAVWNDYFLKRDYKLDFSNDSIGTFIVNASIQENKLFSATSVIQPVRKIIERTETVYKVPAMQPWLMLGSSVDLKTNKIQLGLDLKNKYVVGVSGIRFQDEFGYTIDLGIKF